MSQRIPLPVFTSAILANHSSQGADKRLEHQHSSETVSENSPVNGMEKERAKKDSLAAGGISSSRHLPALPHALA